MDTILTLVERVDILLWEILIWLWNSDPPQINKYNHNTPDSLAREVWIA
jgi:hypothetical protein